MANELTDLQKNLQGKVAEKIRSSFMDLIPPEMFDKMVDSAMDEFINGNKEKRGRIASKTWNPLTSREELVQYNPIFDSETLPGMIMVEIQKKGRAELIDILSSPDFTAGTWINGKQAATTAVEDMIKKHAPDFVTALFSSLVNSAMTNITNSLRNNNIILHM